MSQYVRSHLAQTQHEIHKLYTDMCHVTNNIDVFILDTEHKYMNTTTTSNNEIMNMWPLPPSMLTTSSTASTNTTSNIATNTNNSIDREKKKWRDIQKSLLPRVTPVTTNTTRTVDDSSSVLAVDLAAQDLESFYAVSSELSLL